MDKARIRNFQEIFGIRNRSPLRDRKRPGDPRIPSLPYFKLLCEPTLGKTHPRFLSHLLQKHCHDIMNTLESARFKEVERIIKIESGELPEGGPVFLGVQIQGPTGKAINALAPSGFELIRQLTRPRNNRFSGTKSVAKGAPFRNKLFRFLCSRS